MNNHLAKIHSHIKTHHKKYLLAGAIGGVGFFALKALLLLFGIAGIFQGNRGAYAMDSSICDGVSVETGGVSQSECEALVGIYNSTQGDGWSNDSSRGDTGSICSWYGVGCSAGSVSSLNLSNNTLAGSIDLSGLPNIEYLDLSKNLSLIGVSSLGSLNGLISLDLSFIGLSDYPDGISSLSDLQTISLQGYGSSSFPPVGGLTNLISINLAGNQINVSTIDLSSLGSLDSLDLSNNNFGSAPSISNSHITTLSLANNTSMDDISNLAGLGSLTTLDVSNCDIENDGLGGFENLSLTYGNITNNCLTIYEIRAIQNPSYTFYDYLLGHNVSYNPQKACGHIWDDTPPNCYVDYYSPTSWTNGNVNVYLTCDKPVNESLTHTFYENGSYQFNLTNTIYNWGTGIDTSVRNIDRQEPNCDSVGTQTPVNGVISFDVTCRDVVNGNNGVSGIKSYAEGTGERVVTIEETVDSNDPITVYVYDNADNPYGIDVNIAGYIPNNPTCDEVLTPSTWTSGSVIVSLTNCAGKEPLVGTNRTQTFTQTGYYSTTVTDGDGDSTAINGYVLNIDTIAPNCGPITYNPTGPTITSGDVIASMTCRDRQSGISGSTSSGTITKTITSSGSFPWFIFDDVGNQYLTTGLVTRIDSSAPTCGVTFTPGSGTKTNGNVMAVLTGCSDDIIAYTSIGGTGHLFTRNDEFLFTFIDWAGNTGSTLATVDRIDKEKPICGVTHSITGSFTEQTNQNVLSTLTGCSEPIIVTTPSDGTGEHLFTGNGEFTFEFRDEAGNTGSYNDIVYWIDTDRPRCVLSFDPSSATSGNVMATLSQCSKTPIIVTNNSGLSGYLFTGNGNFTFQYRDASGNTGFTVATVTWIDREKPVCSINYSPATSTSQDVTASIGLCSKTPIVVTNNNSSTSYLFKENGNFTFQYRDILGNTGSTVAAVSWIHRGGGPTGKEKDVCLDGDFSPSYYDGTCKGSETHGSATTCVVPKPYKYSTSLVTAFQRAYSLGITTMCPIDKAGLNSNLIRKHMAKMISEFAMDVIGMQPDTSKKCTFGDTSKVSNELTGYIKLACQLGLMGYKTDGVTKKANFDPEQTVSNAQFATILSRLLRGTKYANGDPYYSRHETALKKAKIMDQSKRILKTTPEIRGDMLIMLMRAKVYLANLEKMVYSTGSNASSGHASSSGSKTSLTGSKVPSTGHSSSK